MADDHGPIHYKVCYASFLQTEEKSAPSGLAVAVLSFIAVPNSARRSCLGCLKQLQATDVLSEPLSANLQV